MVKCIRTPLEPKKIRGAMRHPVKVIKKGKDWVDWMRPDGMKSRDWDFMGGYKHLKKTPVGCWVYYPKKK